MSENNEGFSIVDNTWAYVCYVLLIAFAAIGFFTVLTLVSTRIHGEKTAIYKPAPTEPATATSPTITPEVKSFIPRHPVGSPKLLSCSDYDAFTNVGSVSDEELLRLLRHLRLNYPGGFYNPVNPKYKGRCTPDHDFDSGPLSQAAWQVVTYPVKHCSQEQLAGFLFTL